MKSSLFSLILRIFHCLMETRIQEKIPPAALLATAAQKKEIIGAVSHNEKHVQVAWEQACEFFLKSARPQVVYRPISHREYGKHFLLNTADEATPLIRIVAQSQKLILFSGTIGPAPEEMTNQWFREGDYLSGYFLDRLAAVAADGIAAYLERRFTRRNPEYFLSYSPGYCGWSIRDQKPIFAWLKPETIGMKLTDSSLMQPLKSVSGVLVGGDPGIHIFKLHYDCCSDCGTRNCTVRMREVKHSIG